jgi:MoaA/NifB/PqqE/SkfB family radical SAM enzyme
MYSYKEIEKVHIELSSACQASCPMCARNHHGGMSNPNIIPRNIDLDFYKTFMSAEFIKQIKSITMCGNFGDPILNNDLLEIITYTVTHNEDIEVVIYTNGGIRHTEWWKSLAKCLPSNHVVIFGIDGIDKLHELHRIGTKYEQVIQNATAFISAGGIAQWDFITFKHNEHQIKQAEQLAKDLGFASFREKQSSRFIGEDYFEVYNKHGLLTHVLEMPSNRNFDFIKKETVQNYKEVIKSATIDCEVARTKSIFVDANGHLWPCCWTAGAYYLYDTPENLQWEYKQYNKAAVEQTLQSIGSIDLAVRTMEEIVDSKEWQETWSASFVNNTIPTCARTCGKFPRAFGGQCKDQFLELTKFGKPDVDSNTWL